jgi:putative nucleotidyltransferase with HDIG domain
MNEIAQSFDLNKFPSLPQVLTRLLKELNGENLNMRSLAQLISQDVALSAKVLAVANSPLYRRLNAISSVDQAVVLLGLKMVRIIVVSLSLHQFFNHLTSGSAINLDKFWHHSLASGFLSRTLAEYIHYPDADEAYMAGLMHDIGKLTFMVSEPDRYAVMLHQSQSDAELLELETACFGMTHSEMGARLIEHWRLEPLIGDAIRHHHDALAHAHGATELVKIVMLANTISQVGLQNNSLAIPMAKALFDIPVHEALKMGAEAHAHVDAIATPLGISPDSITQSALTVSGVAKQAGVPLSEGGQQLSKEVHDTALLSMACEIFAAEQTEAGLLASILQMATILFEPRQAFVFAWDSDSNLISGIPVSDQGSSVSRIRFSLEPGVSLVAEAMLWGTVTRSRHKPENLSMIDQQLLQLVDADIMYCVPVYSQKFMFGAIVLGFSQSAATQMDGGMSFLAQFAGHAAKRIHALRSSPEVQPPVMEGEMEAYRSHVRQIVHEANNPLTILKNYLHILDIKLAETNPGMLEIKILNEEIDRVAQIIRRLTAIPENENQQQEELDINGVIREVITLHEKSLFPTLAIKVETSLAPHIPAIISNRQSLKQILVNLFKNAAEAMTQGGVLKISTALVVSRQVHPSISITVADNGPGIPKEIIESLFSPVKSTKGGENAGLGLSITANIVHELGGTISCKSHVGVGTVFEIILPCESGKHSGQDAPVLSSAALKESGR